MNEKASLVVVDIAKDFINLSNQTNPKWQKGYFRFLYDIDYSQSCRSYSKDSDVFIVDSMLCSDICSQMDYKAEQLFYTFEKSRGLILLIVDSDFNYDIKFEWSNLDLWQITKLDGGNGIPCGL